jgi:hypothetical protein
MHGCLLLDPALGAFLAALCGSALPLLRLIAENVPDNEFSGFERQGPILVNKLDQQFGEPVLGGMLVPPTQVHDNFANVLATAISGWCDVTYNGQTHGSLSFSKLQAQFLENSQRSRRPLVMGFLLFALF